MLKHLHRKCFTCRHLLKLGSYAFIRFSLLLFPKASVYFLPLILAVTVISLLLASFTVLRQTDLKRIIAYASIAHMNFLVAALFVQDVIALKDLYYFN
jgi:NADH-quinone oxidoreductase subunit M